tara:strand:+ start:65 stop:397 length:333 start_codon:yes stop_codon:yes gene_type:complete
MGTTDRLKRSISTTDSTEIIQEAKFLCGQFKNDIELVKKIIRIAIADLSSGKSELRTSAMRYILSPDFKKDCETASIDHQHVLKAANDMIQLKKNQQRAITKKLMREIGV